MFSFTFNKLSKNPQNWKIIINGHEILCSKTNADIISKKIFKFNSEHKTDLDKQKEDCFFTIEIPEFDDNLICVETDYQLFSNIFNKIPVQISIMNKEVLKIFAKEFEIEELSNLIQMFERNYELITNDETMKIQKEITSKIIDLNEENFNEGIYYLLTNENNEAINDDFISNALLTACLVRAEKIELFIKFLLKFDEKSNGNKLKVFKEMILLELGEDFHSNEIRFIIRHLYDIGKLTEDEIRKFAAKNYSKKRIDYQSLISIILNQIKSVYLLSISWLDTSISTCVHSEEENNEMTKNFTESLNEYVMTGSNPDKIYQAIKNDDIDSFAYFINQKYSKTKFNEEIQLLIYERHSFFNNLNMNFINYAAFYSSDKIFNYILMNIKDPQNVLNRDVIRLAFIGGNISIINNNSDIMKYRDKININQHNIKKACPVHMLCKIYRELRESEKIF